MRASMPRTLNVSRATLSVTTTGAVRPTLAACQGHLAAADARARFRSVTDRSTVHLANRLRDARAERELSQTQLAEAVAVSRQTISSIETGQYCPSALLAFRLAAVLQTRIDDLFRLEGGTP